MLMSNFCKFFDIQNYQGRIGNGFCKKYFCIWTECSCDFFRSCISVNKSTVNAQFLKCNSQEVKGSSVNSGSCYNMIACFTDVEDCIEIGSLSGRGKNSGNTALQVGNLCCYGIVGWILKTSIEITLCFQIEKLSHFISSIVFVCCTLIDWERAWFTL